MVLFLLAVAIAGFSKFNSGSVTVYAWHYKLEFSLNFLLLTWLIGYFVSYYLLRLYINLKRLPNKIHRARIRSSLVASRRHLNAAGIYYFEGKFRNCYNSALKSIKKELNPDSKFIAYLLALRAASLMHDNNKIAKTLEEISAFNDPKWKLARYMVMAENFYNQQRFGQCIDNLNSALQIDYKHVPARLILLKVYLKLANYQKAYEILEWLLKNGSLSADQIDKYKMKVMNGLFLEINDVRELKKIYKWLSRDEQLSIFYGKLYFDALIRLEDYNLAIDFLEDNSNGTQLRLIYSEAILALAKKLDASKLVDRLLSLAEKSLTSNRSNINLLLALGILNYKKSLWDKAQAYLESCVNIKPYLDAYLYLSLIAKESNNETLLKDVQDKLLVNIHNLS